MRSKNLVVVVEDEPGEQLLLRTLFNQLGFEVESAVDGDTALEIVSQKKPVLLCVDLSLPHISGFDVCEAVRENPETKNLPLVVVTGRYTPQDLAIAESLGVDAYFTKPVDPARLALEVGRLSMRVASQASLPAEPPAPTPLSSPRPSVDIPALPVGITRTPRLDVPVPRVDIPRLDPTTLPDSPISIPAMPPMPAGVPMVPGPTMMAAPASSGASISAPGSSDSSSGGGVPSSPMLLSPEGGNQ